MTTPTIPADTNLFQRKRFQMHSGGFSDFKLECDALTSSDYDTLAFLVARKIRYNKVFGVPRGGVPFAQALAKYVVPDGNVFLIADDVLTTGGSMERARAQMKLEHGQAYDYRGIVVFSRGICLDWVEAIFHLDPQFWQND